jgi:hypothetical protein
VPLHPVRVDEALLMNTITVYRTSDGYCLHPPDPLALPIPLALEEGVKVMHSAGGQLLAYLPRQVYGISISRALAEGWCRVAGPERPEALEALCGGPDPPCGW